MQKARELHAAILRDEDLGVPLGRAEQEELREQFLPAGLVCCRKKEECRIACAGGRCTADYWRRHAEKVSAMMAKYARLKELPVPLYAAAGFVYDLDYLQHQHDADQADLTAAHPFPIVAALRQRRAPKDLVLAVLEHASSLQLGQTSELAQALVVLGDAVTLDAMGLRMPWPDDLQPELRELFESAADEGLVDSTGPAHRFDSLVLPALRNISHGSR